jgi:hypothetical protein
MKNLKLELMKEHLFDTEAKQDDIESYVEDINEGVLELDTNVPTDVNGNFESQNLSLSSDVGVHIYSESISEATLSKYPDAKVVIQYADGSVKDYQLDTLDKDEGGRLVLSFNLTASQMTDEISVSVVFDHNNRSTTKTTSVRKYADTVLSDSSYSDAHDLVKAMLNYGAYAQQYFGYGTDNLANEGIFAAGENPVENSDVGELGPENPVSNGSVGGITPAGWTLALDSDIKIRFYFATYNVHNYEFSVTKPNGVVETLDAVNYEGNVYRVEIGTDDAAYINDNYTLSIKNVESGAVRTVTFSAMMYVDKILSGSVSSTTELNNIAKAIKLYCEAADDYNNK